MANGWNPWTAVRQGQQVSDAAYQAQLEGRALRDELAARQAAALMGAGDYLTGYEGVRGAERPAYMKRLWAAGNPDVAVKMESLLAQPFALQREIYKAGEIEKAKRQADREVFKNAMTDYLEAGRGPAAPAAPAGPAPTAPAVGEADVTAPEVATTAPYPGLMGASPTEETFEMTPQGPKFSVKRMSEFEQRYKDEESRIRRVNAGTATRAETRAAINSAHDNVRNKNAEILAVETAMQNRSIPWEHGKARLAELEREKTALAEQRDRLLAGRIAPAPPPPAAPAAQAPVQAPAPAPAAGPPAMTEKERAGLDVEQRKARMTAANDEIAKARKDSIDLTKYEKPVKELFDIVTTNDIGHPELEAGGQWAASALALNPANARVKNLNDQILNMFIKEGQSRMMDTIIEGMKRSASVPGLFTEPQQNKINAANLRSYFEHLKQFPAFLEGWAKKHDGTLDGAAEAWMDYTDNNPRYGYTQDQAGRVKVHENKGIKSAEGWTRLRQAGGIKQIGKRMFIRQADGSWVEQ